MRVDVLYFGVLKDLAGRSTASVDLCSGASVALLLEQLGGQEGVWRALAVAVNREYASLQTILQEGDEVALLPPVSGGSRAR